MASFGWMLSLRRRAQSGQLLPHPQTRCRRSMVWLLNCLRCTREGLGPLTPIVGVAASGATDFTATDNLDLCIEELPCSQNLYQCGFEFQDRSRAERFLQIRACAEGEDILRPLLADPMAQVGQPSLSVSGGREEVDGVRFGTDFLIHSSAWHNHQSVTPPGAISVGLLIRILDVIDEHVTGDVATVRHEHHQRGALERAVPQRIASDHYGAGSTLLQVPDERARAGLIYVPATVGIR